MHGTSQYISLQLPEIYSYFKIQGKKKKAQPRKPSGPAQTYALSVAMRQTHVPSRVRKFLCLKPPSIRSHTYCREQRTVKREEEETSVAFCLLIRGQQKTDFSIGGIKSVPGATSPFSHLKHMLKRGDFYLYVKFNFFFKIRSFL